MKKSSGQVQLVEEKILKTSGGGGRSANTGNRKVIKEEVKKEVNKDLDKVTNRSRNWRGRNTRNEPKKAAGGISLNTAFGNFGVEWLQPRDMSIQRAAVKRVEPRWRMMPKMAGGEYADCICGTDSIKILRVPQTGYKVGDVIHSVKISPALFPKTRLAALAPLWTRFRFRKLAFEYDNIADSTKSGQILGFYDPDASRDWEDTADNFEEGNGMANSRPTQISQAQIWEVPSPNFTNMFTGQIGSDVRLQEQGQFVLIATSDLAYATVPAIGTLYVKYIVEMYSPQNSILHKPMFASIDNGVGISPAVPFGTSPSASAGIYSDLSYTYDTTGGSKFTLDASGYTGGKLSVCLSIPVASGTFTSFNNVFDGIFVNMANTITDSGDILYTATMTILREDPSITFVINGTSLVLSAATVWFTLVPAVSVSKPSKEQEEISELQAKLKKLEDKVTTLSIGPPSLDDTHRIVEGVSRAACTSQSCSTCDKGKRVDF